MTTAFLVVPTTAKLDRARREVSELLGFRAALHGPGAAQTVTGIWIDPNAQDGRGTWDYHVVASIAVPGRWTLYWSGDGFRDRLSLLRSLVAPGLSRLGSTFGRFVPVLPANTSGSAVNQEMLRLRMVHGAGVLTPWFQEPDTARIFAEAGHTFSGSTGRA